MMDEWLETFWSDLLSEEVARVLDAWTRIDENSRLAVQAHLIRMMTEDGWADVQRSSARSALHILNLLDELIDPDQESD